MELFAPTPLAMLGASNYYGIQIGRRYPFYPKRTKKFMSQLKCVLLTLSGYFLQYMLALDWSKGVSYGIISL